MTEQISMFDAPDPLAYAIVLIVEMRNAHEKERAQHNRDSTPFDKWLLDEFSSYCGGNCYSGYYEWVDFSPKGIRLRTKNWTEDVFVPKKKILKAFGIKDDHKDILKDCE